MEEKIKKFGNIPIRLKNWIGTTASLLAHTFVFGVAFALPWLSIFPLDEVLLVMTTVLSIEAIYLAIFIQMTVNRQSESLEGVQEDVQEISQDVEEISENVEGLSVDVEEISQDVEEISEDVDKIQEEEQKDEVHEVQTKVTLEKIEVGLQRLLGDIEVLKQQKHDLDALRQQNHDILK